MHGISCFAYHLLLGESYWGLHVNGCGCGMFGYDLTAGS